MEAVLNSSYYLADDENQGDAFNNREELHRQLISSQASKQQQYNNNNMSTEDEQFDEKEIEQEYNGPIHYTTKCKLVCSVCTVTGTLSITANELYFEVNEDDETYKTLDTAVSLNLIF